MGINQAKFGGVIVVDIYLVRHGITDWNSEGKWQGQRDIELNEEGIMQAQAAAERFKNMEIDGLYCSQLKRAIKTAEIINQYHGLQIERYADLNECNIGPWDGKTLDQILQDYSEEVKYWHNDIWAVVDGVESLGDLQRRAVRALKKITKKHNLNDKIIIVAHGLAIRTILCWILNLPMNQHETYLMENASVSHVIYDGKYQYTISSINETWHIDKYALKYSITSQEKELD
ncbi:MAG: histidine phosphatase family protein [Defluviitoga tunisiensis]|jgi:broad specificity phosphatase PhoE